MWRYQLVFNQKTYPKSRTKLSKYGFFDTQIKLNTDRGKNDMVWPVQSMFLNFEYEIKLKGEYYEKTI